MLDIRMTKRWAILCVAGLGFVLVSCNGESKVDAPTKPSSDDLSLEMPSSNHVELPKNPTNNAYFGDLHIHTKLSFDAYIFNVRVTPDDAYNFARGETITHPSGFPIQLKGPPLDFVAVTDHAAYMGILPAMDTKGHPLSELDVAKRMFSDDPADISAAFLEVATTLASGTPDPSYFDKGVMGEAWQVIVEAAERHYLPGELTTFIGYEYTSAPDAANLHRNVIFETAAVPSLPFSAFNSQNPEDLWMWMDEQRAAGNEVLAIPHNSNVSNSKMFERQTYEGMPFDAAYADLRNRNEPIVEVTQVKGTSETHPDLSPNDEWADFEIFDRLLGFNTQGTIPGGYTREAYRIGHEFQQKQGFNPYKFGLIGASDTHVAGGSLDEESHFGKVGVLDSDPRDRGSVPPGAQADWKGVDTSSESGPGRYSRWSAAGLAGVWAPRNTREDIFAAMQRRETFATSGTRLKIRFFAGYEFGEGIVDSPDFIEVGYNTGITMGGDIMASEYSPDFLVWASRDPLSAPLQRLQIIKTWVDKEGASHEKVFDVACSDGLAIDESTWRCADNGASVDVSTCAIAEDTGDAELKAQWRDPEYNPDLHANYFVRVLENPTCRWSTWDAIREGTPLNPDLPAIIQERAWSSPIWLVPRG